MYVVRGIVAVLMAVGLIGCTESKTTSPAKVEAKATTQRIATTNPSTRSVATTARINPQPASVKEYIDNTAAIRAAYSKPSFEWPKPTLDPSVELREIGKLPPVTYPADNPYTEEKEELGRKLFFDPRLSGSGQIACASCHDPDLAWADGRTVSFGHDRTPLKRNAPSILFAAYLKPLFWDGRAATLEEQFQTPVAAHDEMNGNAEEIEKRLDAVPEYKAAFKSVFNADKPTLNDAAKAVATFERKLGTLVGRSDFDKFVGGRTDALSDAAVRGLHIYRTSARCMNCHNGPEFTDGKFHDLGLSYYGRKFQDLGRYEETHDPRDVGRFRTPTLRDIGRTGPYMHNGLFNLPGVINMYNAGMVSLRPTTQQKSDPLFPKQKSPLLKRLGLGTLEREDLQAFLESLDEPKLRVRPPTLPAAASETSKND